MSEIRIKVVVDGQESIQTIDELNKSLDSFKKSTEGLDDGSKEVDDFNKSIEDLQKTLDDGLKLDLDADALNAKLGEVSNDLTQITGTQFDIKVDVPEKASLSLRELKVALKEAKDEAASAQFGSVEFEEASIKAGLLKDEIFDVNEAINAQTGEPIERIASQFKGLGESLITLDFDKATKQLGTLNKTISSVDFNKAAKGASEFGKVLGGSVKNAASSLGKTLLANPLFLLAAVVVGIVIAIVELKDKFEIIQVAIDAATLPIRTLIQVFKDLSDALGLSNFEEQENLEKTAAAYDKKVEDIDKATQKELQLAQARGASAEEQLAIEEKAALDRAALAQKQLDENAEYLKSLENKVAKNKQLTDKEKEDYEKLKVAVDDLADAQFQLEIITAKRGANAAAAAAKAADTAQKDTEKARQEYAKYLDDLQKLTEKYILTDRQRIEKQFDADLKRIKGTSKAERELIDEINKDKEKALLEFDAKQLKQSEDLQLKIRENQLRLATDKALEAADTAEEILAIEKGLSDQILGIEIERIDSIKKEQIALANGNAELILKATQDSEIAFNEAQKSREDSVKASEDKILQIRKAKLDEDTKKVNDATDKQLENILKARKEITDDPGAGFGILGSLEKLKENFDKERQLAQDQATKLKAINDSIINSESTSDEEKEAARQRNIELEKKYQETLTGINAEESATREEILQDEIDNRAEQIGQALSIVETLSSSQLDTERGRLEESRTLQDAEFERRRQQIEESITDEKSRAEALNQLDRDIDASNIAFEKKAIDLRKREIKRERNFALASIALAAAQGIATALSAANKTDPISFALTLAANLAAVFATIAKARSALKDANAAESALGAGGGGSGGGGGDGGGGATPPPQQQFSPSGFQATGVNAANFQGGAGAQTPTQPQQFVSVVEIERVRNSVTAVETSNTIGVGG